jgi:hypothetical protein
MKKRNDQVSSSESSAIGDQSERQTIENEIERTEEVNSQGGNSLAIIDKFRKNFDWSLVWTILAIKGLVLLFGVQAYYALANKPIEHWRGWLEIWNYWDSLRHARLAESGYTNVGIERYDIVGFPLFPWITRLFALIFQDYLVSGFIVSTLATIAAGLLLHKLVLLDFADSIARRAVWFMMIFPTSYFLHINYNESLFLALAVGCFLAARRENWMLAGILGALLCLTRINGLIIIPALLTEAFLQFRISRKFQWRWLWLAIIPVGFGIYLALNQNVTGNAFAFLAAGRENFQKSFDMPWNGIRGVYFRMWDPEPGLAQMIGVHEFVFVLLGAIGTIASMIFLRASFTVWMFGNWLLFTSVGFIMSVPRFTLAMFPIYILFAKLSRKQFWHSVITVWSLLLLALFVSKFVQGHWTF